MDKKTLLILTPAFPADESEKESVWLPAKQRLIKCVNRNFPEVEVIILSFQFPLSKQPYYWHNNLAIPFGGGNKNKGRNWLVWLSVFRKLKEINREKNVLGILSFWCAECALVAHYFSRFYQLKHICWICGQDAKKSNKFVRRIKPKATELAAMSDFLMDEFYKNHQIHPAHFIPNGIDPNQFELNPLVRNIDIIGIGGLHPLKQFDVFINIIASLKANFPNIKVVICGDGEERKNLERAIAENHLGENISLTGEISPAMVFDLMQRSKVLLHTSAYEGFGNIFIEALYAGAHVVSFIKPVKKYISRWYVAASKNKMISILSRLLEDDHLDYHSSLPFDMNDSAKALMQLFLQNDNHSGQ